MLDFNSALYLGLQHPTHSLLPWQQFTTGAPAALVEPVEARVIGQDLSALLGCEAATLGTSTLHLDWDLFNLLAKEPITIYMDANAYPITRWGVQRAAMRGAHVKTFPHHDVAALRRELDVSPRGRTPVIVTDGFCPRCGCVAPLREYRQLARIRRGLVVVDDTQALGILGRQPSRTNPYGQGGGGSCHWADSGGQEMIVVASLAKAFGVPVAVLGGSHAWVERFKDNSETRIHCSPPSIPVLHATEHALRVNRERGEPLRQRLRQLIQSFRAELHTLGVTLSGGLFPVQTLRPTPEINAIALHENLARQGIKTVLQRSKTDGGAQVTLLLSARHSLNEIHRAAALIGHALNRNRKPPNGIKYVGITETNR